GQLEAKIKDKHLLVVPSGALTTLPLSVLVTEKPTQAVPATRKAYRKSSWLGLRQPITILPSVSSLKGLRELAKGSHATKAYLGIGNPWLEGEQEDGRLGTFFKRQADAARRRQRCSRVDVAKTAPTVVRSVARFNRLFRGVDLNVEALRELAPLPET